MSKETYRVLDIMILSVIACISEGILTFISNQTNFLVEGFSVSFMLLFTLIALIRWNLIGVIPSVASAITGIVVQNSYSFELFNGYSSGMIAGVIAGCLSTSLLVLLIKFIGKKQIKDKIHYLVLYSLSAYLLFILFYSIVWSIFDRIDFFACLLKLISWNIVNFVMTSIVLYIASRQRGLLVDMTEYLIDINTRPESAVLREEIGEDNPSALIKEVSDSDEVNDIALLDGGMLSDEDLIRLNNTFKEKEGENYHGTRKS